MTWLYTGDFAQRHLDIREKRKTGTGQWLLELDEFSAWKGGSGERVLWGKGIRKLIQTTEFDVS